MTFQDLTTSPTSDTSGANLLQMLETGGPIVWVLGALSAISLGFAIERFIRLRGSAVGGSRFGREVLESLETRGPDDALAICRDEDHSMSRVLGAGLRRAEFPLVERDKAVEDATMREFRSLSANLRPMMVVSVIAPLLGLLGTVWGMITAFQDLAEASGKADPEELASGISMALITTAVGLGVAIPSQAFYYWFKSRVDKFIRNAEYYYHQINEVLVHGVQVEPVPSIEDETQAA